MTPIKRAKIKPFKEAPPKIKMASKTMIVEKEVLNVRRNVEFSASLTTS